MDSNSDIDDEDEFFDAEDSNHYTNAIHRDLMKCWHNLCRKKFGRTKLPATTLDRSQISVWSILKQCIGKELYRMTMPVIFNEPISMLQRFAECVQYAYLLDKADESDDPHIRMQYVAAFAVSTFSSNFDRVTKPFNPLLGETFEFVHPELAFRYTSEQVSHHPPVTAFSCEPKDGGKRWKYYGSILPDAKFTMTTMQIDPKGSLVLEFNRHKETYTWKSIACTLHNIVVGRLWFEYYGTMEIINHANNMKAVINFKPYSWATKELHKVEGYIFDSNGSKIRGLYGFWTDAIYSIDIEQYEAFLQQQQQDEKNAVAYTQVPTNNGNLEDDMPVVDPTHEKLNLPPDSITLWRIMPRPDYASQYYNFSSFTMALNEWTERDQRLRPRLPPTDSRFRPDIRRLEEGNVDMASQEKNRLEEKQRATRQLMENRREKWEPRWFNLIKHHITGDEVWISNDKYWQRNWSNCPDIY